MCGYITYDQYKALGGEANASAFPRLEILARKKLDYWTQERIKESDEDIRLCMVLIIDAMNKVKSGLVNIASTSNDGLTVNYASAKTEDQMMGSVYVYFSILTGKGEKGTVSIIVNSDGGGNAGENSSISIDLRSVGTAPTEYTYSAV